MANTYDAEAAEPAPDTESPAEDAGEATPAQVTKDQCNYRAGDPIKNCGLCGYFQSKEHKCDVVDEAGEPVPGQISPFGYCKFYLRQDNPFGQQLGPREASMAQEMMQSGPDQSRFVQQSAPTTTIGSRTYR